MDSLREALVAIDTVFVYTHKDDLPAVADALVELQANEEFPFRVKVKESVVTKPGTAYVTRQHPTSTFSFKVGA